MRTTAPWGEQTGRADLDAIGVLQRKGRQGIADLDHAVHDAGLAQLLGRAAHDGARVLGNSFRAALAELGKLVF